MANIPTSTVMSLALEEQITNGNCFRPVVDNALDFPKWHTEQFTAFFCCEAEWMHNVGTLAGVSKRNITDEGHLDSTASPMSCNNPPTTTDSTRSMVSPCPVYDLEGKEDTANLNRQNPSKDHKYSKWLGRRRYKSNWSRGADQNDWRRVILPNGECGNCQSIPETEVLLPETTPAKYRKYPASQYETTYP
jgi:hypothetical protein